MRINKKNLEKLKKKYGNSFYMLDVERFVSNYNEMISSFSKIYKNFGIAYSYKTNYIPVLCKAVNFLGGYAEIVSDMELELALRIGVEYSKIIWNGPIKEEKCIFGFLENGGIVNADNIDELKYINQMSKRSKSIFKIGLRCNYDIGDNTISRFGFDVNGHDFNKALDIINSNNKLNLYSMQCHFAKRNIEYWINKVDGMLLTLNRNKLKPSIVDIGGGMYGKMDPYLKKQFACNIPSYEDYANVIARKFYANYSKTKNKPKLIVEPGSALVGDCMEFAGVVKSIKKIQNKFFATVYASQKNISMSNINPPIKIIAMGKKQKYYKNVDFVGYTCIENDVIFKDYCGYVANNDFIIISNCGSYSIVMKPPFIMPNVPVISISSKKEEIIKQKESFDDIFAGYVF